MKPGGQLFRAVSMRAAAFALLFAFAVAPAGAADDPYAVFRGHDENSNIHLTYPDWNFVLSRTVLVLGASHRYSPKPPPKETGSRISRGNTNPSWIEGNRVVFDRLDEDGIKVVTDFRKALEALPDQRPIETWSRNEQLAYWLNLYNATVYEQVAQRYPYKNVRGLHEGRGRKHRGSVWEEKLLKVAGVPLSLNDIEHKILIPNYQDPRILYGLFQAMIGGPNIRRRAFTARSVWAALDRNADEFVNSIRGVHRSGSTARASLLYEWGRDLFPNFEVDLRRHLEKYADADTAEILANTKRIKANYFDWSIADLYNGEPNAARSMPTMFGTGMVSAPERPNGRGLQGLPPGTNSGAMGAQFSGFSDNLGRVGVVPEAGLPIHTQALFRALHIKFQTFGYPQTNITIEEMDRDEKDDNKDEKGPGPKN